MNDIFTEGNVDQPVYSSIIGLRQGQHRIVCPKCSHTSKKKTERTMSVEILPDSNVKFNCWHCGSQGGFTVDKKVADNFKPKSKNFEPPAKDKTPKPLVKAISKEAEEFLKGRGLSKVCAESMGVKSIHHFIPALSKAVDCLAFPYNAGGETAWKVRALEDKGFACIGSPKNFFGVEAYEDGDTVVIVEGEIDALSVSMAADSFDEKVVPISVPNGAVNKVVDGKIDPSEDTKFKYLWDNKEVFETAGKIIIACDDDPSGSAMAEELSRRIGRDKVLTVHYPEGCKDTNDVLIAEGINGVVELFAGAKPLPMSGLYDPDHFYEELDEIYARGLGSGETTGYKNVDELYTVSGGQLTVVTGIPSCGKSEFIDQLMTNLAENRGWKFAVCSFENEPKLHLSKLASKYLRKPFFDGVTPRMTRDELATAKDFIQDHFVFLYQADGSLCTIDHIIARLRRAVLQGVRGCVIDPYNYIERDRSMSETDWVSEMLTKLRVFAQAHDIHIWFVAHPAKMRRLTDGTIPVPNGHDISGSAAFYAKADVGMTMHRPDPTIDICEIHIWKCRHSWVGKQGMTELRYDKPTATFTEKNYDKFFDGDIDRTYNTNVPF